MEQDIGGYLATPEKGAGPAVIVIPDDPEFCDRLAVEGFTALTAPGELVAAIDFLKPHPAVRGEGVGIVGLGPGVDQALSLAADRPGDVVAVVVYSETAPAEADFGAALQSHAVDDRDSWIRTLEFLRKHLG
jgi:dienelactone hydrolase